MTEAMKRFLELNELMEREMQAQRQEAKAAEKRTIEQARIMRKRIDEDLLELNKLGVGSIKTNVSLNLNGRECDCIHSYIVLGLYNQGNPHVDEYTYVNGHTYNTYSVYSVNNAYNVDTVVALYEHWPEIMASAEEQIMKKIIKRREDECAKLEREIQTRDELLAKIKSALEDK